MKREILLISHEGHRPRRADSFPSSPSASSTWGKTGPPRVRGARRLLGCQQRACPIGSLFGGAASIFDYSRPVASRSGRLVLELQRERRAAGVTFCVCSPMTGDVVVLPVLVGKDNKPITNYGCQLLTGDDLHPRRCAKLVQLPLVYSNHRQGFTALRCYSSDTGRWGTEVRSAVNVSSRELRHIGPAVVLHGAAFWALNHGAPGLRRRDGGALAALRCAAVLPGEPPSWRLAGQPALLHLLRRPCW